MKKLIKTIDSYFQNHAEVVAVYLFGSHANEKARLSSDVDIGIILRHEALSTAFALKQQYMAALGRQLRKDIHAVILNTAGELLLKQVFTKGVCVCVNDDAQFMQFKMIRYTMISEFSHYLQLMQRGFRRNILEDRSIG